VMAGSCHPYLSDLFPFVLFEEKRKK